MILSMRQTSRTPDWATKLSFKQRNNAYTHLIVNNSCIQVRNSNQSLLLDYSIPLYIQITHSTHPNSISVTRNIIVTLYLHIFTSLTRCYSATSLSLLIPFFVAPQLFSKFFNHPNFSHKGEPFSKKFSTFGRKYWGFIFSPVPGGGFTASRRFSERPG